MAKKLVLEANIRTAMDCKHEEKRQRDNYALSLFTPTQREGFDTLLAGAVDPKKTLLNRKAVPILQDRN
jgi:hypothetical protein